MISRLQELLFNTKRSVSRANRATLASLLSLAWVVESRDPYTGGHLWRVARYSSLVAQRSGLSGREIAWTTIGGFLHDLGKIGIPDAVLRKAAALTDEEYDVIKTHPAIGAELLTRHPAGAFVLDAVYAHHERPDGKGYPLGLRNGEITPMAAIVGICDAFDAMTSARPYRAPMPKERAFSIIHQGLGTQFDFRFGTVFTAMQTDEELEHIIGHSDDGIPLRDCLDCGPIVVVRRETTEDTVVHCPACGTGYNVTSRGHPLTPAHIPATANDLRPSPDKQLIDRMLETVDALF